VPNPGRTINRSAGHDDPQDRFWDRLLGDWAGVFLGAFMLQGLWFGFTSLVSGWRPDLAPSLETASARLGVPWLLAVLVGLGWGVKRARDARREPVSRRGSTPPV
jgi:hypothetical protein